MGSFFMFCLWKEAKMFKKDISPQTLDETPTKSEKCLSLTPEELANLRKNKPEQIAGTPEWKIMVHLNALCALYDKSGFLIDLP